MDQSELRQYYEKLWSGVITKQVNTKLCDKAIEQYSRRECWEISCVPESVTDNDLEGKVLNLLEKIYVEAHSDHIEDCHQIKSKDGPKKVIIKIKLKSLICFLICLRLASIRPCSLMIVFVGITSISRQTVRNWYSWFLDF